MPSDLLEKAREFARRRRLEHYGTDTVATGGGDERISLRDMADFASERVAEAVAEERRQIADDLEGLGVNSLDRSDYIFRGLAQSYIDHLRGE